MTQALKTTRPAPVLNQTIRMDVVVQALGAAAKVGDKGGLAVIMCGSELNRLGWRLHLDGCRMQNFQKNPVVLWSHRTDLPAIGQAQNVRIQGDQMLCDVVFDEAPFAQDLERMYRKGILRAWSVSYQVLQYAPIIDAEGICQGYDILEWELIELSAVTVNGDATALTQALKSATDEKTVVQFLQTALSNVNDGASPQGGSEPKEVTAAMDEKTIRTETLKQSADNLKALRQAFPKDASFVLECAEQGLTPDQAKGKHYDVLALRVATLETEKQGLDKKVVDLAAENADLKSKVLSQGQAPAGPGSGAKASGKFMERVRQGMKEQKMTFKQALKAVREADPEGFKAAGDAGEL